MNVRRCRFYAMDENPEQPLDFGVARSGWFMGIFQSGDSPMALVEAFSGEIIRTFPEYVKFERSELDVLMDRVIEEVGERVARSKQAEMEKKIRDLFTRYAFA